ncbi:MAG: plasmid pRiA4b ORF-3 family protein [Chloroflexota bacterium]
MPAPKSIYQIKVTLQDSRPTIWRRFLVGDNVTLHNLHDILQIVMGWTDSHLHMFHVNGQIFGDPMDDKAGEIGMLDETRYRLSQLVGREGAKFRYEYDFGDDWMHNLIVEKILPFEKGVHYPVCIKGKRACPPEDVGGVWGYDDFLEAISNPKHPEHDRMLEWIGGDFDPAYFNLDEINERLRHPHRQRDEEQDYLEPPSRGEEILVKIANWVSGLDKKQIALTESLAVRRDMVILLSYLKENHVAGTQSTGNLPLKAVRDICAKFVNPPVLDEKIGDKVYKLRSEDQAWPLFFLHMLANTGGLVTGGQARIWKLTSSGEAFLNAAAPLQLGFMLDVWWHYEDWRIAFPVSGLSQGLPNGFAEISLKRLRELSVDQAVSYQPFADQLIAEAHFTWPSLDQDVSKTIRRGAIERMVILPLVGFGCLETEYGMEDIGGSKFSKLSRFRLTQLGKGLLGTL